MQRMQSGLCYNPSTQNTGLGSSGIRNQPGLYIKTVKKKKQKTEFQESQRNLVLKHQNPTQTTPNKQKTHKTWAATQPRNISHYSWAGTSFRRWLLEHRNLGSTWSVDYGPEMEITQYGCLDESQSMGQSCQLTITFLLRLEKHGLHWSRLAVAHWTVTRVRARQFQIR